MSHGSGTNLFIHIASYGLGGIFVNFIYTEFVKKNDNSHISPLISIYHTSHCLSIQSMCKITMFNAKCDRQIKVDVYFARDIISKIVLEIKICEKY